MKRFLTIVSAILFCSISLKGDVINGDLRWFEGRIPSQATIDQYHAKGIKCPDAKGFASNWSIVGKNGSVEFPKEDKGNRFVRFSGDLAVGKFSFVAGAEFVAFDNLAENMSITRRYNSFLDGWDYSRKASSCNLPRLPDSSTWATSWGRVTLSVRPA